MHYATIARHLCTAFHKSAYIVIYIAYSKSRLRTRPRCTTFKTDKLYPPILVNKEYEVCVHYAARQTEQEQNSAKKIIPVCCNLPRKPLPNIETK